MKIDRFRLRKSTSEVPPECLALIDRLRQCSRIELLCELSRINTWIFGKCELYHWITVLDIFDTILEEAAEAVDLNNKWALRCDYNYSGEEKKLLLWTLHFTTLLIEHSFSRHLYNSMEHLLTLLNSFDMQIVLAVLNLLYMFSKRSNFITRLANDKREALTSRLHYLAESWGGKENGFGMADCCDSQKPIPPSATTVHFEFCKDHASDFETMKYPEQLSSSYIHIENIDKLRNTPPEIMQSLTTIYFVPPDKEMWLYTHVRLAFHYANFTARLLCVQARLQALSVLAYSNSVQDSGYTILYDGLLEELVELVQLDGFSMVDIRSAALRTLTSIIHLDRVPHFPKKVCSRLSSIIDATGANQYHGFLPTLVRNCISCLIKPTIKVEMVDMEMPIYSDESGVPIESLIQYPQTDISQPFPLPLATSLFSFLYHLASYEAGGEALVACGVLESLLQVINWRGEELEHITFVTRAVRVIDLITNIDMQAFQSYDGLQIFIERLDAEVSTCRPEQGYEFKPVKIIPELPDEIPDEPSDQDHSGLSDEPDPLDEPNPSDELILFDQSDQPGPSDKSDSVVSAIPMESSCQPGSLDNLAISAKSRKLDHPGASNSLQVDQTGPVHNLLSLNQACSSTQPGSSNQSGPSNQPILSTQPDASNQSEPSTQSNQLDLSNQQNSLRSSPSNQPGPSNQSDSSNDALDQQEPSEQFVEVEVEEVEVVEVEEEEDAVIPYDCHITPENFKNTCLPQRAALLKSMLNFLKKAIQDAVYADCFRQIMEGILPSTLKHIVANAEYYGASLFLLATDLVTVYVFQEPSFLSILQDNGLTDVVIYALLEKDVPVTREVLGSVPNVFSAVCLNARGLQALNKYQPFERFLKIFLTPQYLCAMRRRRSSDPLGDTASNIGNAMDELMRHQPAVKADAVAAIVKLLHEVCQLGYDSRYICWRPHGRSEPAAVNIQPVNNPDASSDEEDDDEDETSTSSHNAQGDSQEATNADDEKTPIPLIDYVHNIMKFLDALLSNNSTDDHCKDFVLQDGLPPLLRMLGLPNLPVDSPVTASTHAVASVCKTIVNLAHEPKVFKEALVQLNETLQILKPLFLQLSTHKMSILLQELTSAPNLDTAFQSVNATPILHALAAIHGYVIMFVHVCRTGQNEIRSLSLHQWGSELGLNVLQHLCKLYRSLVWESTLLLAICSDKLTANDYDIGQSFLGDLNFLVQTPDRAEADPSSGEPSSSSIDIDGEASHSKATPQHLKYIKPLLAASSRLGRALAELFGLLVKLSVGNSTRQRRGQTAATNALVPAIHSNNIAMILSNLVAYGLDYHQLPQDHVIKYKITFLICCAGFTDSMLFDEKRFPYHLMLHKFVFQGGLKAFFNTFNWIITIQDTVEAKNGFEHPDLPEGSGEFLDSWLTLLEKMVNTKALLESPYYTPGKAANASAASLRNVAIFNPLRFLIQVHKYAFDAVLCMWGKTPLPIYGMHMCESMLTILKHIVKADKMIKERLSKGDDKPNPTGFSFQPEVNEDFLGQLMEMGFSRESALEAAGQALTVEEATDFLLLTQVQRARTAGMDVDTEDDQVMQAIALSLGESGPYYDKREEYLTFCSPIPDQQIEKFMETVLCTSLNILKEFPDTIFKICELIGTLMKRSGQIFRDNILSILLSVIKDKCKSLLVSYYFRENKPQILKDFIGNQNNIILGNYTHLFTLLFEISSYLEIRTPCALALDRSNLIQYFSKIVVMASQLMVDASKSINIQWLTPILLLLDVYEKVVTATQRKVFMHQSTSRIWKWYDLSTGKWNMYSEANNKIINDAYWSGEQSVRVICGRRRYIISFTSMLQCNEESGNNRAVTMALINFGAGNCYYSPENDVEEIPDMEAVLTERETYRCLLLTGITGSQSVKIVRSCARIIYYPVEKHVLHAILRLCVRYTRDFACAKTFIEEGGVECLLNMKSSSAFTGYGILITILMRHLLEEPQILIHSFEKVIRGKVLLSFPPTHRELIYLFRQLEPAMTRCPSTFLDVAKSILRVDTSIFKLVTDIDARSPLKAEPSTRTHAPILEEETSIQVIFELLNALLQPIEEPSQIIRKQCNSTSTNRELYHLKVSELFGNISATSDFLNVDNQEDIRKSSTDKTADIKTVQTEKPLLAKHAILKILADAVVSYGAVAKLITDFTYKAGCSPYITEDCSALAFMFDHLLPATKLSDRDAAAMCRVLVAAIASGNHCPEAQSALVSEVRAGLMRALMMPESYKKHNQVQLINGIITAIIENCPPSNQLRVFKNQPLNGQINNIVRLMLKKGLFNDLGKLSHYMDLSSPLFPSTINSSLKPMESLSRIVNQPFSHNSGSRTIKRPQNDPTTTQSGTTSTEATNAQGEEAVEDAENTEHDISAVASSLEDGALDQILNNESNESNRTFTIAATVHNPRSMDIDDDSNVAYEPEADATEELMSTDSGDSDSNASDQDADEENEDNDIDDDDDDIDEDEDDTSGRVDEDVLMVQYADHELDDSLPRMVRWNENGFAVPLFDDGHGDQNAPSVHPLLGRPNGDGNPLANRNVRNALRARRYQYLNVNQRNANPPVILQRLLGPVAQNLSISTNELMNSATREAGRVMVMDNFGIVPTNEEQIDFVDQSGFLFGPSLLATLNHLPSVLYWWNEEFKLIEDESAHDLATYLSNKMAPHLLLFRNIEIYDKFKRRELVLPKSRGDDKTLHNTIKTYVSTYQQTVPEGTDVSEDNSECTPPNDNPQQMQLTTAEPITGSTLAPILNLATLHSCREITTTIPTDEHASPTGTFISIPEHQTEQATSDSVSQDTNIQENDTDDDNDDENDDSSSSSASDSSEDGDIMFDELTSHEDLTEIERVASEGLADRQLQEPYLPSEPFEEPNDTSPISSEGSNQRVGASNPTINSSVSHITRRQLTYLGPQPLQFPSPSSLTRPNRPPLGPNIAIRHERICPLVPYSHESGRWPFPPGTFIPCSPSQYTRQPRLIHPVPQQALRSSPITVSPPATVTRNSALDNEIIVIGANNSRCNNSANPIRQSITILSTTTDTGSGNGSLNRTIVTISQNPVSDPATRIHVGVNVVLPPPETNRRRSFVFTNEGPLRRPVTSPSNALLQQNDDIPDGVDPSFIAALPAELRREVLDYYRSMQPPTSTRATVAVLPVPAEMAGPSNSSEESPENGVQEVNPEFLAALPPAIQEEVLTNQRIEQQRQAAANSNPNEPLDAGAFFDSLQPSLRTMILSDMEESQISVLPPAIAAEAQTLRREWEARNRQLVQERFLQTNLSTLMRHSARGAAVPRIQTHLPRAQWGTWENRSDMVPFINGNSKIRGRPLLDGEALSCLLVLLFVDDSKLSTIRLHRVIRNLCYHAPTRDWIIKSLLSIIQKTVDENVVEPQTPKALKRGHKPGPLTSKLTTDTKNAKNDANWLNIRREPSLGCRSDVFIVSRSSTGKWTERNSTCIISIHPRAAPTVCKNAIDLVISLSKNFPSCLLPLKLKDEKEKGKISHLPAKPKTDNIDFWDVLIKLDCTNSKKGKSVVKSSNINLGGDSDSLTQCANFDLSPFGQLLRILSAPLVNRNPQLTDKLLNLASVITAGLPEVYDSKASNVKNKSKMSKYESIPISESCLSLIVTVLKTRACSEDGLEDATSLLLNLAKCSFYLCRRILTLLIECVLCLGRAVRLQISNMLHDMKKLNKVQKRKLTSDNSPGPSPASSKGTLIDRFTNEQVIISPSSKIRTICDLQLPSMAPLTSKSSSQVFFLRVLCIIVQIRETIQKRIIEACASEKESGSSDDPQNVTIASLSTQLADLEKLWETLSSCLTELEHTPDDHAVLVLQPAVEAFFLVHSPKHGIIDKNTPAQPPKETPPQPAPSTSNNTDSINLPSTADDCDFFSQESLTRQPVPVEHQKFVSFAEKHRTVLNQILRQSKGNLSDGPFAVLIEHTRVLDFDIKRRYFRSELERMDRGFRREEMAVHVHRNSVFEDSFRELFRRSPEEWKHRFYIVFDDEEGQDAGGLLREWYLIISKEIFNPMYALFTTSPGDRVTYTINPISHYNNNHLCYYRFVGRVIAKAIYDNKLLECYFTRSLYKHILGIPLKHTDMESEDYSFYKGLEYLIENNVKDIGYDITFCSEIEEFGVTETRDLIPNGSKVVVTEANKLEYIRLSCQMKMTVEIRNQLNAFLKGFYDIIPRKLISIFNEQELELMISGLPNIDIDELKAHTEYHKYQSNSLQIQWFWRALRSFDQADRAKFLQFVTGTSKVPLQGFEYLEGMNGVQKFQIHRDDRSTDRLPSAHTCFNQLDLPVYETSSKLREYLLKSIHECSEGFGFA